MHRKMVKPRYLFEACEVTSTAKPLGRARDTVEWFAGTVLYSKDSITIIPTVESEGWHEPQHSAWDSFANWSAFVVSPGMGSGHLVKWYWVIFKAGWKAAKDHRG